jgi:hypothetical protein
MWRIYSKPDSHGVNDARRKTSSQMQKASSNSSIFWESNCVKMVAMLNMLGAMHIC